MDNSFAVWPTVSRSWIRHITSSALFVTIAFTGSASADVEVTQCGQEVNGTGFLSADLDCSAYPDVAVRIKEGKLLLNGFTITSNLANHDPVYETHGLSAVLCEGPCKVVGPGTITGAGGGSLNGAGCCIGEALSGIRVRAFNVTLEGNGGSAFGAGAGVLRDSIVRNNAGNGVVNARRMKIRNTTIENNGLRGVSGDNGEGALGIRGSTITGHPAQGVEGFVHVAIRDTVITGNGTDQEACDFDANPGDHSPCVDLYVDKKPTGGGIECGTSYERATNGPTGLCTFD